MTWTAALALGNRLKKEQEDRRQALESEGVVKAFASRTMPFVQKVSLNTSRTRCLPLLIATFL